MKATIQSASFSGGIFLTIEPETQADAALLVRLGMNASADTNKVFHVTAVESGIFGGVCLDFRSDRAYDAANQQATQIRRVP